MRNEKIILIVVFGAAFVAALFYFPLLLSWKNKSALSVVGKEATIVIDYGDGAQKRFRARQDLLLEREENAWSLLQRAGAVANLSLNVTHGFIPIAINDYRNGFQGKRWVLYTNGERQENIPLSVVARQGDHIAWRFE